MPAARGTAGAAALPACLRRLRCRQANTKGGCEQEAFLGFCCSRHRSSLQISEVGYERENKWRRWDVNKAKSGQKSLL
jgi:hypothetical protein